MHVTRGLLKEAVDKGLISPQQSEALWQFLREHAGQGPGFQPTHVLYYLGGMLAIGAMTLFMTLGWERFGGWGILAISLAYAAAGMWATELLRARRLWIPMGITATFVVVLTPLAIYGLQDGLGWWAEGFVYREYHTHIDWRWTFMELATLAVAVIMLWRYRAPFLVMPMAVTLWYISMDLTPFLFGVEDMSWELRRYVSMWFGLVIVLLAFWVDVRTHGERNYAFWLYLFGVVAFWTGLSLMDSDSELSRFLYLCVNLLMIAVGAMLAQRVFVVFGALGAAGYIGYLAYDVFADSMLFPFVLTFLGFAVIYLGILWQRHERDISRRLRSVLPAQVRQLVEHRH